MWSIPRNFSESSTLSTVATSLCWPGLSITLRSARKSMPAGFSFGFRGTMWNWPVFIAPMISLSERAISVGLDDNGFKKASEENETIQAQRIYCQQRHLFAPETLSQQICRFSGRPKGLAEGGPTFEEE